MRITSDGFVGVGTTSIPNPFSGAYSNILQVGTDSGNTRLAITAGSSSSCDLAFADSNNASVSDSYAGTISYKHATDSMLFTTATTERMRIDSSGRVGLGQTSMTYALEVINSSYDNIAWGGTSAVAILTQQGNNPAFKTVGALDIEFYTNNSERMRLDSSGNLAVGGTSANGKLNVFSNGSSNDVLRINADDARGASRYALHIIDSDPNSRGSLRIATTSGASITTTNAVGIGTSSPSVPLHISSNNGAIARFANNSTTLTTTYLNVINANNTSNGTVIAHIDDGTSYIGNQQNNALRFVTNDTERMRIDSAGKVGIGKTPSTWALDLDTGLIYIASFDGANNTGIVINSNNSTAAQIIGYSNSASTYNDIDIKGNATAGSGVYIDGSESRVGIGITAPSEKLHVVGNGLFTGSVSITADGQPALSVTGGISCGLNLVIAEDSQLQASRNTTTDSVAAAAASFIDHNTGSGNRATITMEANSYQGAKHIEFYQATTVNGSISSGLNATGFNTSSDYRLKEDLKDFNGLDKVSKIPVYDFKWKSDDNARAYGVMAHELQEILPQAVSGDKDERNENGKPMYQGVDYSKLVPVLLKSIQELEARVKELENK